MPNSGQSITPLAIGIETFHKRGYSINRPKGSGNFVFIHFLTPVQLFLTKKPQTELAETCLIYVPPKPQHYQSLKGESFGDNWMHFSGRTCLSVLKSLGLPLNQPFRPASTAFIVSQLRRINDEKIRNDEFSMVGADLAVRGFLLELARNLKARATDAAAPQAMEMREQMIKLRSAMNENCFEGWTLDRMADLVHLSKSRFSVVYRKMFRTSPIADLVRMRVELAQYYLGMMQMPIETVAESCGFPSIYYFFRQFKKLTGMTPGAFRRVYGGEHFVHPHPESLKKPR